MLGLLMLVIRRDLILAMRRRADVLTTLIFFVMVVSLFPLGVGPETAMLRKMAAWLGQVTGRERVAASLGGASARKSVCKRSMKAGGSLASATAMRRLGCLTPK